MARSVEAMMRNNGQKLTFSKEQGLTCWNREQHDSHCQDWMFMDQFQGGPPCCEDYSVRYCCTQVANEAPMMVCQFQYILNAISVQEMVNVGIIVDQERVFQKVILYTVLQVLVIMMPAHASFEGVMVVMDSFKVIFEAQIFVTSI